MFCPNCGQEKTTPDTNFCSRCGFLLSGTQDLLRAGGVLPTGTDVSRPSRHSPRARGIKQGIFIFLLTFLVAPIVGMISVALDIQPFAVGIASVALFFGGLLRIVYAFMFEEPAPKVEGRGDDFLAAAQTHLGRTASASALSAGQPRPATDIPTPMHGRWRDTNDLEPRTVTEGTTKLLEQEERTQ